MWSVLSEMAYNGKSNDMKPSELLRSIASLCCPHGCQMLSSYLLLGRVCNDSQLCHVPVFERGKKWCMLRLVPLSMLLKGLKTLILPGWDSCIWFGWPGPGSRGAAGVAVRSCLKLLCVWQSQLLVAPTQTHLWPRLSQSGMIVMLLC